jgi:lipopolysaccharide transport system ATP-binding protein
MSVPSISISGLGKRYRLGMTVDSYNSLRETLAAVVRPKNIAARLQAREAKHIWAVRDVSFDVEPGEVVGVIGRNGAGKSTLLRMISRITEPTKGEIRLRGRVACLLEVGTGFHPELTGRENIYLSGAILGMKRAEISAKFDEIVDFSGVEKFLDTPIKRYSSGMNVRLGFAVAAHLEPEILLVDEVLAVGDHEFQRKCLGRMEDATKSGRTVLFVSHNMASIEKLCGRTILLDRGQVEADGSPHDVIAAYLERGLSDQAAISFDPKPNCPVQIMRLEVRNRSGALTSEVNWADEFDLVVVAEARENVEGTVNLSLQMADGVRICYSICANTLNSYTKFESGRQYRFSARIPGDVLNEGLFNFVAWIVPPMQIGCYDTARSMNFQITAMTSQPLFLEPRKPRPELIRLPIEWHMEAD